jgi:hypothetical protein
MLISIISGTQMESVEARCLTSRSQVGDAIEIAEKIDI